MLGIYLGRAISQLLNINDEQHAVTPVMKMSTSAMDAPPPPPPPQKKLIQNKVAMVLSPGKPSPAQSCSTTTEYACNVNGVLLVPLIVIEKTICRGTAPNSATHAVWQYVVIHCSCSCFMEHTCAQAIIAQALIYIKSRHCIIAHC